jgi:hypothetical protein
MLLECSLSWKAEVIILLLVDIGGFVVWTKHNHIITVIETWRIMNVE